MYSSRGRSGTLRERGAALIVTLLFVVLLTFLIVAYFSRTVLDRQIAASSSSQQRADSLAQGALNLVIGELEQEIASGSRQGTAYETDGVPIFIPVAPATSVPSLSGKTATPVDMTPNLVKRSAHLAPFFTGTDYQTTLPASQWASGLSTYQPGAVGLASITPERWNKPLLLPLKNPASLTDNTPVADFAAPDWIFVDPSGPVVLTGPKADVLGRFAYTIYNIGNLLDINVAGSPKLDLSDEGFSDAAVRGGRQAVPLIDLTVLPGMSDTVVAKIVTNWRNKQSAASKAAYQELFGVTGPESGFRKVSPGDHTFLGRRDLLDFWGKNGLDRQTLQYLTTFSREKSAPSFFPSATRPKIGDSAVTNDGNGTRSATFGRDDEFNPVLANLRWPEAVTLYPGTTEEISLAKGEPFLFRRFDLRKLNLFGQNNPDPALIKRYFGLTQGAAGQWVYDHGGGGKILTLPELVSGIKGGTIPPREPDFFELLQAGMLQGSLGRDSGLTNPQAKSAIKTIMFADQNTYLQVLRIGANIIDQWDADSYPTEIALQGIPQPVYGVENLPYLAKVYQYLGAMPAPNQERIGGWYLFEMWNPHQAPILPTAAPAQFRVTANGTATLQARLYYVVNGVTFTISQSPVSKTFLGDSFVNFTSAINFSDPKTLEAANGATVDQIGGSSNTDDKVRGLFVGDLPGTPNRADADEGKQGTDSKGIWPDPSIAFSVQYNHPVHGWKTYDVMRQLVNTQNITHATPMPYLQDYHLNPLYFYMRVDPRSDRFVSLSNYADTGDINKVKQEKSKNVTQRSRSGYWNYLASSFQTPDRNSGFRQEGSSNDQNWLMGAVEVNASRPADSVISSGLGEPPNRTRYMDADGVFRKGDGAYSTYTDNEGHPLYQVSSIGTSENRPLVLNRPFRSVGELGYVFRDTPWKSLDFFTEDSADSALLDLFTVGEISPVTAGKVNPNTPHKQVLQAILSGALIRESLSPAAGNADLISKATAEKVADAIITQSKITPLMNRGDLVNRIAGHLGSNTETFDSVKTSRIKARREAALRSLSNVTNTRTWNVMIDLIAQTGRFPDGATKLEQFRPTAEKRYWLHLAIDRYTGEIVEKHLESVYE